MAQSTHTSVARQATFDTDPDRAKIKRGTLKLPVIQAEDTHRVIDSNSKSGEKKTVESKGKQTANTEKPRVSTTNKREHANEKHVSAAENRKSDTKGAKPETNSNQLSEKQKRLNALNQAHKTAGEKVKETEPAHKEETNKTSVLKDLNSKRSKSPEKKQNHQKTPDKGDKEVENKTIKSKVTDSVSKRDKSPSKRDQSPQKEPLSEQSKKVNESKFNAKSSNGSKDNNNTSHTVNSTSQKKKPANESPSDDHKRKEQAIKSHPVKVEEPSNKTEKIKSSHVKSPIKHQSKDVTIDKTQKGTSVKIEEPKTKKSEVSQRNRSPEKSTKSPKPSSKDQPSESTAIKENRKTKHHLAPSDTSTTTIVSKSPDEKSVTERGRSPEKKVSNSKKEDKDKTDRTKPNKEDKTTTVSVEDNNGSPTTKSSLLPSNSAPAETKLTDTKITTVSEKHSLSNKREVNDNSSSDKSPDKSPSERNGVDLTTAFALLVTEGSNHIKDNLEQEPTKVTVNTPNSPDKENDRNKEINHENEHKDTVPELKIPTSESVREHNNSENSKSIVRQTYVISPSPTKLERGKEAKSQSGNISELVVEPIEIEAKPKGQKMQGRESYEQVYAERNTLLKAEYTYRKRIKQLEDEANGFLKTIEDFTSENRQLRDRVDTLENDIRNNGDRNAHEKVSHLENDKIKLESRIKQLEQLANSNANVSEGNDAMAKEIRELKAQVIKLQTENQSLNEENIKLKSENYENVKKLHAAESEAKSLATSVTAVESEKMDKIQDLKNEHSRVAKDTSALRKKNEELGKKVETLEFENASLSETLLQKKNELKEIMTVMKDENKFDNDIKDLTNQVSKLQKDKKDMEITHTKELKTAMDALEELKTKSDSSAKDLHELKIKSDEMEKECKLLKKENKTIEKVKQSQETEIASLNAKLEKFKEDLKDSREKHEAHINKSKSDTSDLKGAKENAEELNRDLQKIVADKENQITRLISQLDAARKDKEKESKTLQSEKERLEAENERLKSLETNLGRTESEFKHTVGKLEDAELKKKQLSIQLQDKGFEISNMEQQVFELNMKLDSSARRISQLDKEKRELEDDRREWGVKKEKLNDIEASNKRLTEENKRLRGQLEMTSYASDYRPPEPDKNRQVVEAWVNDNSSKTAQHAMYVQKEKKKVQIVPNPTNFKKRANFSKSSPVKSSSKTVAHKSEPPKNTVRSSRSLEDLRRSPNGRSPDSEPSLPELQKETRLTTHGSIGSYGGTGSYGYSQIHRNRIKAMHKKVY